jgi:hypothetical protein
VVSFNTNRSGSALGGGIYSYGPLTISYSTISGNASDRGGGIFLAASASITNSTISGNSAAEGGGLYVFDDPTDLVNDTISGNSSDRAGGGTLVHSAFVRLYNVTAAANVANAGKIGTGGGGGICNEAGSVTLNNSILSGNSHLNQGSPLTTLDDCSGTFGASGNNIVTAALCTINGLYSSSAAKLGPLRDNGGPTLTHALLAGSPALDIGICFDPLGALDIDQRGVARPQGAACDLGAFELNDPIFADGFEPGA